MDTALLIAIGAFGAIELIAYAIKVKVNLYLYGPTGPQGSFPATQHGPWWCRGFNKLLVALHFPTIVLLLPLLVLSFALSKENNGIVLPIGAWHLINSALVSAVLLWLGGYIAL